MTENSELKEIVKSVIVEALQSPHQSEIKTALKIFLIQETRQGGLLSRTQSTTDLADCVLRFSSKRNHIPFSGFPKES